MAGMGAAGVVTKKRSNYDLAFKLEVPHRMHDEGFSCRQTAALFDIRRLDQVEEWKTYGHSGLLNMVKTYDLLAPLQEEGGHWSVSLLPKAEGVVEADVPRT